MDERARRTEFAPDGKSLWVSSVIGGTVSVVDAADFVTQKNISTFEVMSYILVAQRVWHMAMTPEEDLLFTTNGVSNDVTVVDIKTLKPLKSIKVGRYPWGAAVRPMSTSKTAGGDSAQP